jgi:radical SAM superfamily enzyme YgiQ (UPF0313 family)
MKTVLIALYDFDSLGVRKLHSYLEREGQEPMSIFFKEMLLNKMAPPSAGEFARLEEWVAEVQPDLVGISLRSTFFKFALEITERIKRRNENTFVIWGGTHPTVLPEQSLEHCDAVCIGEGEEPFLELVCRIEAGQDTRDIENLWFNQDGEMIKNPVRPLQQNLDLRPFSNWDDRHCYYIEDEKLFTRWPWGERKRYPIMTSLGCPFSCTYCCNSTLRQIYGGKGKYVRRRSVANVTDELVWAKDRFPHLSLIDFYDDVFTFDKEWLHEFAVQYERKVALPFFCYTHPSMIDEEMVRLLKHTGLKATAMGIQSGSEDVRGQCYHRTGHTNEDIVQAAQWFHQYDIEAAYDVLLDNPFENEADRWATLDLLLNLPRPFQIHQHSLTFFPGTPLTATALAQKVISEEQIEGQEQKSLQRWTKALDARRSPEELFWDVFYYMTKIELIPKGLIQTLSRSRLLRRYPQVLRTLLVMGSPVFRLWSYVRRHGVVSTVKEIAHRVERKRKRVLASSH